MNCWEITNTKGLWIHYCQEWQDKNLTWNPDDFDGNRIMYIPAEDIWHPDYVLFNKYGLLYVCLLIILYWKDNWCAGYRDSVKLMLKRQILLHRSKHLRSFHRNNKKWSIILVSFVKLWRSKLTKIPKFLNAFSVLDKNSYYYICTGYLHT